MKELHAILLAIAVVSLAASVSAIVFFPLVSGQEVPYIKYIDEDGNQKKFWQAELLLENTVPNTVTKITFQSNPDDNPSGVSVNRTHIYAVDASPMRTLFDVDVSSRLVTLTGDENTIAEYVFTDIGEEYRIMKLTTNEFGETEHFVVHIPKDRILSLTFGSDLF